MGTATLSSLVGSFVQTTQVWDISQIYELNANSPEFKEFLVLLYQQLNQVATVLNTKDSGFYDTSQFVNGQILFPNPTLNSSSSTTPVFRQIQRLVINFGPLPNTATKSVAHGITITAATTFTRIYATANDPSTSFIPIPYASNTAGQSIELNVDATNVNITTGSDRTAYTTCYVILEYVQS